MSDSFNTSASSITLCFHKLCDGDHAAAQRLWETYFERLAGLARNKIRGGKRLMADEEDVALSAFDSFCRAAKRGRYPQLSDRSDLWNLLVSITMHKALHVLRNQNRKKRGGGQQIISNSSGDSDFDLMSQLIGCEPAPEVAMQVVEDAETLLAQLPSQDLRELATFKLEGYTNAEIAARWQKAERTVERKLSLIRKIWSKELEE